MTIRSASISLYVAHVGHNLPMVEGARVELSVAPGGVTLVQK